MEVRGYTRREMLGTIAMLGAGGCAGTALVGCGRESARGNENVVTSDFSSSMQKYSDGKSSSVEKQPNAKYEGSNSTPKKGDVEELQWGDRRWERLDFEWFKPVTNGKLRKKTKDGYDTHDLKEISKDIDRLGVFIDSSGKPIAMGGFMKSPDGEKDYSQKVDYKFGRSLEGPKWEDDDSDPEYKFFKRIYILRFIGDEDDLKLLNNTKDKFGNAVRKVWADYTYETENLSGIKGTSGGWGRDCHFVRDTEAVREKGKKSFHRDFFIRERGIYISPTTFRKLSGLVDSIVMDEPQRFNIKIFDDPKEPVDFIP